MKGLPHLHYGEVTSRNSGLLRDFIFFLWRYRPHISLDHLIVDVSRSNTHTHTHTAGRTPLYEWSARRRGRYLHNPQKHMRLIFKLSVGFELQNLRSRCL